VFAHVCQCSDVEFRVATQFAGQSPAEASDRIHIHRASTILEKEKVRFSFEDMPSCGGLHHLMTQGTCKH
jgi:hypothetical protein